MARDPKQSWGQVLGVAVLVVGIGVASAYALDLHSHTCEACGRRWRHLGAFNIGDQDAHTCACGTVQWWKSIHSDGAIAHNSSALQAPALQARAMGHVPRFKPPWKT